MSHDPDELIIGNTYVLTEYVNGQKIAHGSKCVLVSKEENPRNSTYPILGFAWTGKRAEVFLIEAHTLFDEVTWRRAFRGPYCWQAYWPIGAATWNHSYVTIQDVKSDS